MHVDGFLSARALLVLDYFSWGLFFGLGNTYIDIANGDSAGHFCGIEGGVLGGWVRMLNWSTDDWT